MPALTHCLIAAAYAMLAIVLGLIVRQTGGASEVAWFLGTGFLFLSAHIHGAVARAFERAAVEDEFADLRRANIILSEELDVARKRLSTLAADIEVSAAARAQERALELKMIESLLARILNAVADPDAAAAAEIAAGGAGYDAAAARDDAAVLAKMRGAIQQNRIDLYLQPVVSLPQRKVRYFEAFSRLRDEDDAVLAPSEYLDSAERANLTPIIDSMLLFRSVQTLRRFARKEKRIGVFCNISLRTLRDQTFFPQFLDYLTQNRDLRSVLIFEFGQAAFEAFGDVETHALAKLAELGFSFSLDHVDRLDFDLIAMREKNFRFVKVSSAVLLRSLNPGDVPEDQEAFAFDAAPDIRAEDFKELLNRYGMDLIAEKLESEGEVVEILDLHVDYAQGHVFGAPQIARDAEALGETYLRGGEMQKAALTS